jgi:hypothetical protein
LTEDLGRDFSVVGAMMDGDTSAVVVVVFEGRNEWYVGILA